jgi:lysophospholipase L1-like esterase
MPPCGNPIWGTIFGELAGCVRTSNFKSLFHVALIVVSATIFSTGGLYSEKPRDPIRYVAIGDSYTIGEGALPNESWPAVLTRNLKAKGVNIELIANPSVTGWTTQQAIDKELPVFLDAKPNFATLLIGVNDWVKGVDEETFRQRFNTLVDRMLSVVGKKRFLIVTIPDFGVTPTGARYARGRDISKGLTRFNEIITEEAKKRDLPVVDIFALSQKVCDDRSLIAEDGLHPSAKGYAEWEKIIFPAVVGLLKK